MFFFLSTSSVEIITLKLSLVVVVGVVAAVIIDVDVADVVNAITNAAMPVPRRIRPNRDRIKQTREHRQQMRLSHPSERFKV